MKSALLILGVFLADLLDRWRVSWTYQMDWSGELKVTRLFGWHVSPYPPPRDAVVFHLNLPWVLDWRPIWSDYRQSGEGWCYPRLLHGVSAAENRWWVEWVPVETPL